MCHAMVTGSHITCDVEIQLKVHGLVLYYSAYSIFILPSHNAPELNLGGVLFENQPVQQLSQWRIL
jgi:hypothetical protein